MRKVSKAEQLRDTLKEMGAMGIITASTLSQRGPCFFDYSADVGGEPTSGCFFSAENEDIGRMASRFAARIMYELDDKRFCRIY